MEQDSTAPDVYRSEASLLYVWNAVGLYLAGANAPIDLSLEFLMGRALDNAMLNVGMKDAARGKVFFHLVF
jgi:hypothetical protein